MKVSHLGTILCLIALAIAFFQNCAPAKSNSPRIAIPPAQLSLNDILSQLNSMNQDLSCASDNDCELVQVGEAICGGPKDLVAVSKLNPNYQTVVGYAEEYTWLDKYQTPTNVVGACWALAPEVAKCVQNICTEQVVGL